MMQHRSGTLARLDHWLLSLSLLLPLALSGACSSTCSVVEYKPVAPDPVSVPDEVAPLPGVPGVPGEPGGLPDIQSSGWPRQENDPLEVHGSIWFTYGNRFLTDRNSWDPLDRPDGGGFELMYDFVKELPFEIEFGFQYYTADKTASTPSLPDSYESFEVYLGIRRSWETDFFATSLYVGGGVAYNWINARLPDGTGGTQDYKDQVVGGYLHTGFYVPLGPYLVTGVDLRAMMAGKYDLGPNRLKADYLQGMLLVGFAW